MGAENTPFGSAEGKRVGRPPLGPKAKDAEVHVRLDAEGKDALDRKRDVTGETRAAWVRRAIRFAHAHMGPDWQRRGDPIAALERAHQCPSWRGDARGPELRTERFTDAP